MVRAWLRQERSLECDRPTVNMHPIPSEARTSKRAYQDQAAPARLLNSGQIRLQQADYGARGCFSGAEYRIEPPPFLAFRRC